MKLFITNQKEFRELIQKSETKLTEANVHQLAFNKLIKNVNKCYVPKIIVVEINTDFEIGFCLVSLNNDIYSYESFIAESLSF